MSDQDFFYFKQEGLELLKQYRLEHHGGRGYGRRSDYRNFSLDDIPRGMEDGTPNYSILSDYFIYDIQNYTEFIEITGLFKQYFAKKGLKILFRGQTENHEFKQLPSL